MVDYEEKYETLKREILMMINNYWAIDNNDFCEQATLLFLRRNKMINDFNEHKDFEVDKVSDEVREDYEENLKWF